MDLCLFILLFVFCFADNLQHAVHFAENFTVECLSFMK